ncbi:hypothetical protein L195_g010809 [Trifolium pratense]|uniref:Uncharacterized protein n=1 Tax=Trifolium pratense TaxID=57577 RepID=A0A2K3PFX1_TRIPR|nr:hypothetical protein L195_g010809 [Trifolium pratense]
MEGSRALKIWLEEYLFSARGAASSGKIERKVVSQALLQKISIEESRSKCNP